MKAEGMPTYIFAGGGTGGHLYPGLAVAQGLLKLRPQARIVFACSNRSIDRKILDPLPYAVVPQPIRPLPNSPLKVWGFVRSYMASRKLAARLFADLKPAAVLGLGGFAAGPVLVQAAKAGVPRALLNPDAVPGKANRLLARHAQVIFTQFEDTTNRFAAAHRGKVRCVGCPIRSGLVGSAGPGAAQASGGTADSERLEALKFFELTPDRRTLLVFGGSLGAESVSLAIEQLAGDMAALPQPWQVLHVTSTPAAGRIEDTLRTAGVAVRTLRYCDRMDLAYTAADLVLARAGAGTVAELAVTCTPAILMPYPYHRDQHQRHNAAQLANAGAAIACSDAKDSAVNAASLRQTMLPIMRDGDSLAKMRQSAAGLGKADAAVEVARWLAADS